MGFYVVDALKINQGRLQTAPPDHDHSRRWADKILLLFIWLCNQHLLDPTWISNQRNLSLWTHAGQRVRLECC